MRALFTCFPQYGHFLPLTPVAQAMAEAGHDVAIATTTMLRSAVEAVGLRWVRAGIEHDDPEMAPVMAHVRSLRGREQSQFFVGKISGDLRPRHMVPDLLAIAEAERPDVLVRDSNELGAMIASELLDVPHATVLVNATGALRHQMSALYEPIQQVRSSFGLPQRSTAALMERYLTLIPFPPSLNASDDPIPATALHFRGIPPDATSASLPSWIDQIGSRPLVYVSMGTAFSGARGAEIFPKLLDGLRGLDVEVVVTVGHELDLTRLGPHPPHIHLERYLPLSALLEHCSLVVFHGGSGTLAHATAHGLPSVILPLGADQRENAARCTELGIARMIDQAELTPEHVSAAVLDVLHTPTYRQNAELLRDEFNALPGPDFAVRLLERLAREKAPIITQG